MSEKPVCAHCGAVVVEYSHNLNVGLVEGLRLLAEAGGTAVLSQLPLTGPQWTNFQKLRYWGLVKKQDHHLWQLTRHGVQFLRGLVKVPKKVWTFRGVFQRFEETPLVAIDDVIEGYWSRADFAKARQAVLRPQTAQLSFV